MSIAKILVPVTGTPRDEMAIAAAARMAKLCNAHMQVQFVHPDPASAVPLLGVPLSGDIMQAIIDGQTKFAQAAGARARQTMVDICRRESIEIVKRPEHRAEASCAFREVWGNAGRLIVDSARLSDLVVFGPVHWRDSSEINEAFLDVLRSVRRPVLVGNSPNVGQLRKIAIGWDGSIVAARAICAVMAILQRAEQSDVLIVHRKGGPSVPTQELTDYLVRNGVKFETHAVATADKSPAEMLINEATVSGADMLVVGGYGHDHLWETIFGGATDTLLANAKIPVLIGH